MASNATPERYDELIASGEDLCDGLNQHAGALGITHNPFADTRADLNTLLAAQAAFHNSQSAQLTAYAALRSADSNGKGFIARAVKVLSIALGNDWSDAWVATGLPDNKPGIPGTQDKRFAALAGLKAYFTANPAMENVPLNVTAATAEGNYQAISDARQAVGNALTDTKQKLIARNAALDAFRERFINAVAEITQILSPTDPRWYDFGLNRPADPAQPGQPANVHATALGQGRVLVQLDGARRANSFDFYKKVVGTDAAPVKVTNTEGTQYTIENLPVGATVEFTVTGVNAAGEGQPSDPVSVVVG